MVATIGYERASLADFIATLQLGSIEILVDIRDRAQSRRAGFSKSALSDALHNVGISYVHMRELGDPKEGRDAARRGDFDKFHAIFDSVLEKKEAIEALAELEEMASANEVCLMCFERDHATCHRKIVADRLERKLGHKTRHLGVREGAGKRTSVRRVHDTHQSAAASI